MTTATTTLTDFLLARIAEDEAMAREAAEWAEGPWYVERSESGVLASDRVPVVFDPRGYTGKARTHLDHIARHDPARVLAECEAKREMVGQHIDEGFGQFCLTCIDRDNPDEQTAYPCPTMRILAWVYADHADYRSEWAP
jgi:hypothetical protein